MVMVAAARVARAMATVWKGIGGVKGAAAIGITGMIGKLIHKHMEVTGMEAEAEKEEAEAVSDTAERLAEAGRFEEASMLLMTWLKKKSDEAMAPTMMEKLEKIVYAGVAGGVAISLIGALKERR